MIDDLLVLIKGAPVEASLILASFSVFVVILLNNRKVNLEGIASVGKLQNENMEAVLRQNHTLAEDLAALRKQSAEFYSQMDSLHGQISDMRKHIIRLEALIVHYQTSCNDCNKALPDIDVTTVIPYQYKEPK